MLNWFGGVSGDAHHSAGVNKAMLVGIGIFLCPEVRFARLVRSSSDS